MKEIGKKTKKMASELCTGLREQTKNTTVNGRTINKTVLVFISGLKTEEKTNISETDMKVTGKTAKEKDSVFSTMLMVLNMKVYGKTI